MSTSFLISTLIGQTIGWLWGMAIGFSIVCLFLSGKRGKQYYGEAAKTGGN